MADYQLTATDSIIRAEDGACIPPDPANRDYAEYLQWVEDGGVPDPYVPPEPMPPSPTSEQTILYDHENRIRAQEGLAPLTMAQFIKGSVADAGAPSPKKTAPKKTK
jgi:hypothetical protein